MKKIYTLTALAICMMFGFNAIAQSSWAPQEMKSSKEKPVAVERLNSNDRPSSTTTSSVERAGVEIYSEDFAGEFPSDWEAVTESGPCTWQWTDVGHTGDYPSQALESTTAANGWMILDSDLCGAEGGDAEVAYLNSPSYDLSDYDFVAFRFEQYYRRFGAAEVTAVEVSVDGGTEWTEYLFNEDVEQDGTANPDVRQGNITALAGGESDVRFRFRWEGVWGYGWQVDDFAIIVPDENDLLLSSARYNKYDDTDPDLFFYSFLEYSTYEVDHIYPMFINAEIENIGSETQSNVQLEVTVSNSGGVIETLTSDPVSLASGETHYAEIEYTPPSDVDDYTMEYNAIMDNDDDNPDNNTAARNFSVALDEYARDNGIMQNAAGVILEAGAAAGVGLGFGFNQDDEIHCLGVAVHEASYGPISITGNAVDVSAEGYPSIAETESITVDEAELNNLEDEPVFTWLPFVEFDPFSGEEIIAPFQVAADDEWAFSVRWTPEEIDGDPENIGGVYIGYGSNPSFGDFANFIWGPQTTTGTVCNPCNAGVTDTYMIRLGMSQEFCQIGVGVEEIENLTIEELFPNPTTGQTTLSFSLLETSDVQIYLFDTQGRIVMNDNRGTQPVGEYRFDYDFSDQAAGMYTMSIMVGDKAINKKLVIK